MNRLCWLVGHKWDGAPSEYVDVCSRCGSCPFYDGDSDGDSWHIEKIYSTRRRINRRWWLFTRWICKCPYCGIRFGRHDLDECCPF